MFQEVPLYNEFVRHVLQLFFIVILRNDKEDKTGASMTNKCQLL